MVLPVVMVYSSAALVARLEALPSASEASTKVSLQQVESRLKSIRQIEL